MAPHARRRRTVPRPRRGRRFRGERGSALVEFALILPLLLIVVYGGLNAGLVYQRKSELLHAVRDGARYGATVPRDQCDTTSNCGNRNWAQLVQYVTAQRSDGALNNSQICVSLVVGSSGAVYTRTGGVYTTGTNATFPTAGCFDDGNADAGMRVHVSAVRNGDKIDLVFDDIDVPLRSSGSARYEQ